MKTEPKLITAPIRFFGEKEIAFRKCYVTTFFDSMTEPNLTTVVDANTSENYLPKMDSVSKQKVLHNLFATQC